MIGKLRKILGMEERIQPGVNVSEDWVRLALAALLVEMARADFDQNEVEDEEIVHLLAGHFRMSEGESRVLLVQAQIALDDAACLHDFTRALHRELGADEKEQVISLLWQVALADDRLDKYEEYLVRKLADLLYVSASDVMRLKHQAVNT